MSLPWSPMAIKSTEHASTAQPQKSKHYNDRKRERSMGVKADIENTPQTTATGSR